VEQESDGVRYAPKRWRAQARFNLQNGEADGEWVIAGVGGPGGSLAAVAHQHELQKSLVSSPLKKRSRRTQAMRARVM